MLDFDVNDLLSIETAITEGGKIWENDCLKVVKGKIKQFYRDKLGEQCCYCRKNTHGEFKMVLDIEHVLPKSRFRHLMFTLYNLSVSCKRCNMNIKNEDISFFTDLTAVNENPENPDLYKFIHPNFDPYFSHLELFTQSVNDKTLIKYRIVADSKKGNFTYEYFKLSELEVDSINKAQGLKETEELFRSNRSCNCKTYTKSIKRRKIASN